MMKLIIVFAGIVMAGLVMSAKLPGQGNPDKASMSRGKVLYESTCLACHQADGSGVPDLNPPIVKTKWVLGEKSKLIDIILKGMDEEIEIDGQFFSNTMPAHPHLKDQEVADILTYVRNSFGNKASAVTASEVKKQRAALK